PAAIAAGTPLADLKKIRGGAIAALSDLGFTAAAVDEQVTARLPTAEEAVLLDVSPAEPLLVLSRTTRDETGRPFEHAVNRMVPRLTGPIIYRMQTSR
ncbi:MAG TPA: UTRA domain-containing protein, partial [Actinoplanes sp.]